MRLAQRLGQRVPEKPIQQRLKALVSVIRKHFTRLNPAASQFYDLGYVSIPAEWTSLIEFTTTDTSNQVLWGDNHQLSVYVNISDTGLAVWSSGRAHSFGWGGRPPHDGKLHQLVTSTVGGRVTAFLDGFDLYERNPKSLVPYVGDAHLLLGTSNSVSIRFDGHISRFKFWEGSHHAGDLITAPDLSTDLKRPYLFSDQASYGPNQAVGGQLATHEDLSGWTDIYSGTSEIDSGSLLLTTTGSGFGGVARPVSLEVGETYLLEVDYQHVDGSGFVMMSTNMNATANRAFSPSLLSSTQTFTAVFVAVQELMYVGLSQGYTSVPGKQARFRNLSIRKVRDVCTTGTGDRWATSVLNFQSMWSGGNVLLDFDGLGNGYAFANSIKGVGEFEVKYTVATGSSSDLRIFIGGTWKTIDGSPGSHTTHITSLNPVDYFRFYSTAGSGAFSLSGISVRRLNPTTSYTTAVNLSGDNAISFEQQQDGGRWLGANLLENGDFSTRSGWHIGSEITYDEVNQSIYADNAQGDGGTVRAVYREQRRPHHYQIILDADIKSGVIEFYDGVDYTAEIRPGDDLSLDVVSQRDEYWYFTFRLERGTSIVVRQIEMREILEVIQ